MLVWIINLWTRTWLGFPLTWQEGFEEEALSVSTLWEQSSLYVLEGDAGDVPLAEDVKE